MNLFKANYTEEYSISRGSKGSITGCGMIKKKEKFEEIL